MNARWNGARLSESAVTLMVTSTALPITAPSWVISCCIAPATPMSRSSTALAISEVSAGEAMPKPMPENAVAATMNT